MTLVFVVVVAAAAAVVVVVVDDDVGDEGSVVDAMYAKDLVVDSVHLILSKWVVDLVDYMMTHHNEILV